MHFRSLIATCYLLFLISSCLQSTTVDTRALADESHPICLQELTPQTDPLCPDEFIIKTDYQHNVDYCCEAAVVLPGGEGREGDNFGKSKLCVASEACPASYELTPGVSGPDCQLNDCAAGGYDPDPLTGSCTCACTAHSVPAEITTPTGDPTCPELPGLELLRYQIDGGSMYRDVCLYEDPENPKVVVVEINSSHCAEGFIQTLPDQDTCGLDFADCPEGWTLQGESCTHCGDLCQTITHTPGSDPLYVLFVVDRSGSMNLPYGNSLDSRWQAATAAVEDIVTTNADSEFGLQVFPLVGNQTCQTEIAVPIGPDTDTAIIDTMSVSTPIFGVTPLFSSLATAYQQGFVNTPKHGTKAVILVSDGKQNGCYGTTTSSDIPPLATDAYNNHGILTFVLSLVDDDNFSDNLAVAGGTGSAFYPTNQQELTTALKQSVTSATCHFTFIKTSQPNQSIAVTIDGQVVSENDWRLANNHIIIEDEWCDAIKSGTVQSVTISTDCDGSIAP